MKDKILTDLAQSTLEYSLKKGASQVAISAGHSRFVELKRRDGKTESLQASTSRGITLSLYIDGRYSSNATSFLEKDALKNFIDESLAMTKMLAPDPFRSLADPELYGPTKGITLDLIDNEYENVDMHQRHDLVSRTDEAAHHTDTKVFSVTAEMTTEQSEFLQIHSNGFFGEQKSTSFFLGASVSAKEDNKDERPEDYWWVGAHHLSDLPMPEQIGQEAARRAVGRIGAKKVKSACMTLVVENRVASQMIGSLLSPLQGAALQQKRSCFEGQLQKQIGSNLVTLIDDPFLPRGLGSQTFDSDGLAAKKMPIFSAGILNTYFIDVYYARKLNVQPTTGSTSNLILQSGDLSLNELISNIDRGILVTSFLGGNANPATGDFSFGISGFLIEKGRLTHPINEMNIADNLISLWHRLTAVGNDPFQYSSSRIPSLVFSNVQFAGN